MYVCTVCYEIFAFERSLVSTKLCTFMYICMYVFVYDILMYVKVVCMYVCMYEDLSAFKTLSLCMYVGRRCIYPRNSTESDCQSEQRGLCRHHRAGQTFTGAFLQRANMYLCMYVCIDVSFVS